MIITYLGNNTYNIYDAKPGDLDALFTKATTEPKQKISHKKHMHIKVCATCGKKCKGNVGLGVHMAAHRPSTLSVE